MHATINQPVQVNMVVDPARRAFTIHNILWQGDIYSVVSVVYIRTLETVRGYVHIFNANVGPLDMQLHLNEKSMEVTLAEISDGLTV